MYHNTKTRTYEVDLKIKMTVAAFNREEAKRVATRIVNDSKLATGFPEVLGACTTK